MRLITNKKHYGSMHLTLKNCICLLLLFISAHTSWAQFTVTAVPTAATCNGNGSIAFSVQGTEAGATINYIVYRTDVNPETLVYNNSIPNVSGQQSGTYRVEATQSVNSVPVGPPAITTVTIDNNVVPLIATAEIENAICGNDGKIVMDVTQGDVATYEILSPINVGPQASEIFDNLLGTVAGTSYTIKITDICGSADTKIYTVFLDKPILKISPPSFPDIELIACDLLTVKNTVTTTNGLPIHYPLQVTSTLVYQGTTTTYNQTIASGAIDMAEIIQVVPYYYGESYTYKVKVTDPCGTVYETSAFPVDPVLTVFAELENIECLGKILKVSPSKFLGPFTLEFITMPDGFNPEDFNIKYPGPYVVGDIIIKFGEEGNPLPFGFYKIKILDACGRTASSGEIEVKIPEDIEAMATASPATCTALGSVEGYIPGLFIESATITEGPDTYPTPVDVSDKIAIPKRDKVVVGDLPPGEYAIVLVDTCGTEYPPVLFEIKEFTNATAGSNARVSCEIGYGSINVAGTLAFTAIEIVSAPTGYPFPLPHNVFSYVLDGSLYMDHLLPGQYKFKAATECDSDVQMNPATFTVTGYSETLNEYELIHHCSSFDLVLNHTSNSLVFLTYGLQKYNEENDTWGHPTTGESYVEGLKVITDNNATGNDVANTYGLNNNATNPNLEFPTGKYRILKQYTSWGDGSKGEKSKLCTQILQTFDYFNELTIQGAASLSCTGNEGDIQILAVGVPPLNYKIVSKNNQPFVIDNGENSVFSGLESAVYTVEVSDPCSTRPLTFNIADVPPLVSAPAPEKLAAIQHCDEDGNGTEIFDISIYDATILGSQNPDVVTITYHKSLSDAELGLNPLSDLENYTSVSNTIHVRVSHSINPDCVALTWFDIVVRPKPELTMAEIWGACEGESITVTADSGFDDYTWSNGSKKESITVSVAGTHTVTVKDEFGCEASKTIQVVVSPKPVIHTVTIDDWTDNNNVITVVMEESADDSNYKYSLDNITYQESPVFTGLTPGQYTVYVKDEFGCGLDKRSTYILTYPKFFTPNGDGVNETWRIHLSSLEPDMLIYIFDRYGKLITGFTPKSNGWDGTLNGTKLPSTDYWFVVVRQNGEKLKGHFSMIR